MKMVVLDGYALNPGDMSWETIEKFGELKIHDRTPNDKIIERIGDAPIVFTNKTPLTKETLQAVPNVKYIGVLATGYNIVDIEAAKEKGIVVTNIPAYSTSSVVQMTFALLLEICHHVGAHNKAVKNGAWESSLDFAFWNYPLIELAGKTIGLVGYGAISQGVAKAAQAFGLKVIVNTRTIREEFGHSVEFVSLDELYRRSDIISLHCPLFDATKDMINKESIAKMKDGVILLNTARGGLIIEQDLADALNSGKIAAAGVDVVSVEPIESSNPLLKAENCIITPHIAWAPKEARLRLMDIASSNLEHFMAGTPVNVVNS